MDLLGWLRTLDTQTDTWGRVRRGQAPQGRIDRLDLDAQVRRAVFSQRQHGIVQHQQGAFLVVVLGKKQRQRGKRQRLQEFSLGVCLTQNAVANQP